MFRSPLSLLSRDLLQTCDELFPQGGDFCHILVHVVDGFLHGRRHAHDAGHILGAATLALFLLAALDEVLEGDAPADVQGADALGAVELVAGQGEHINVHLFHVDGHVTHRLDGVGVEGDLSSPGTERRSL